jgi:hypothetical protein
MKAKQKTKSKTKNIKTKFMVGPPGFELKISCGCCALGLFRRLTGPHASVTFGSFSIVFGACCWGWVFVVVAVIVWLVLLFVPVFVVPYKSIC